MVGGSSHYSADPDMMPNSSGRFDKRLTAEPLANLDPNEAIPSSWRSPPPGGHHRAAGRALI